MSSIHVQRNHSVDLNEAKNRIKRLVEEFIAEHPSLVSQVDWAPDGASAQAKGKGFQASFRVDARTIDARIELGLLLSALRGRVQASLEKRLDAAFPK